ncbi:hypothetical protein ABE61_12105 [Lysinibacillus sphaericus]|nr:hypothetical protein [Lysinibacillus sphaericus]MBG9478200.1 hypothetical protein [Lysinibacillus sphaericus]MBG9590913.1 hypothetical protein [Lysinibacillus sphaericus]
MGAFITSEGDEVNEDVVPVAALSHKNHCFLKAHMDVKWHEWCGHNYAQGKIDMGLKSKS